MTALANLPNCFLTGTDTDVGKTFVACTLLHAWRAAGHSAAGYKPVAAGAEVVDGVLINGDARALQDAGTPDIPLSFINPVCLPEACSPHIAAALAGVEIELSPLIGSYLMLQAQAQRVVVEGAGGFCVPLSDELDTALLARILNLPVVLVVGLRLGCLNHALLTQEAIRTRGLTLAGWVGNTLDPNMPHREANLATLAARLDGPCLGVLPRLASPSDALQYLKAGGVQSAPL